MVKYLKLIQYEVSHSNGISPIIISTESTHERVPFKHSVVRLYIGTLCLI